MSQSIWHHPQSVAQALKLLSSYKSQAVVVGGATTLALKKDKLPAHIIDLSCCNLDFVRVSSTITAVGAMTRLSDLTEQTLPGVAGKFIAHVAANTATTPLRNMITLGGNLAQCYTWSIMPVVMLAMDNIIQLRTSTGRRRVKASKFFANSGKFVRDGEILTLIEYPIFKEGEAAFGFEQIKRTHTDYPLLSVAVWLEQKDGVITEARIVVGSAKPRPVFCYQASVMLKGRKVTDDIDISAATEKIMRDLVISNDPRASVSYKQEMVAVLANRAIKKALADLAK